MRGLRWTSSTEPFLKSNNPHAVRQAMVDMLLIGMADDAVISGWSTFGNVAVGMSEDMIPMLVTESTCCLLAGGSHARAHMTSSVRNKTEAVKRSWHLLKPEQKRTGPWPPDVEMHSQRVPNHKYLYMNVPHYSFIRSGYVRVSTKQPCLHLAAYYAPDQTTCFTEDMVVSEMSNGRYC